MAGRLFRRIVGSGSGSGGSRREDEEVIADDDSLHVEIPTPEQEQGSMQIILSKDNNKGHWWTSKAIKMYVTWSFTRNIGSEFFTKWSEASEAQRKKMWNYFARHVKSVDPEYNPYPDWQRKITRRITQLVNGVKYCKNKPEWCPTSWFAILNDRESSDPEWAKISKINKANRMSGAIDGKALATHVLGRKSVSDVFNALGDEASPYKIFEKTKKNKKGEWVNPRAKEIDAAFHAEMSQQSAGGGPPDEIAAYYKAAKGYDKKSRLFGQGEEARRWYQPPSNKSERRSFSYNPTEVTLLTQKVRQLEEGMHASQEQIRLNQEQFRSQQEQLAAMQAAWAQMQATQPPGTCSGFTPRRRDDFADDGHGFGGSSVEPLG